MQIGSLVRIATTNEIGIVTERVSNEFNRWVIIGLLNHVGDRYEMSFPNKYVEVVCK